jgi:hypothetical protein
MELVLLLLAAAFGVVAAVTRDLRWLAVGFVCFVAAVAIPALDALT